MYQFNSDSSWVSPTKLELEGHDTSIPAPQFPLPQEASSCDDCLPNNNSDSEAIKTSTDVQLEDLLSNILKSGVFLACAIVLVGGVLYLIRHGAEPANYQSFHGEPSLFRSPVGVVHAISSGYYRGIIQLGLLILIATPVVRVAVSLLVFLHRRDFTYVVVTLLVLAGLIYSLTGAYF